MNEQNQPPHSAPETTAPPPPDSARSPEHNEWLRAASDPTLTGDQAQALLERADLPADVIEQLARNRPALKLRKVKIALACHLHTPRHLSVPLIRQFYTFDLMKVALSPTVPADIKLTADATLISRLETITQGERSTLARRASGKVAGALLLDAEERIMRAALENGRMTEAHIVQAILSPDARAALVHAVSQHEKWCHRRDVQLALLRTEHLSLARALAFTREMSSQQRAEILQTSRLPEAIKNQLLREIPSEKSPSSAE
jgi:hypothetical protein